MIKEVTERNRGDYRLQIEPVWSGLHLTITSIVI
jgi:hypothetical protein